MRRFSLTVVAVAALLVAASSASAQGIRWGVGAGLLMPIGDYGDADKMGFVAGFGGTYSMPGGIGIRGELSYSQTSHDGVDGSTKMMGGMASLVYALGATPGMRPYLMGGLGLYNVKIDVGGSSGSESKVAFGFGGGLSFPMGAGGSRMFVETKFTSVSTDPSLTYLPIVVGISF